ncbi:MAG: hypothetical protein N3B13_05105, partial [Deltaproteobacteria bacterium]|nr:hypothetical protein [Deltaproteobacteria bacterium]
IFMFGFPVLTALLYFRLTDSFSENIRKTFYVLKTATESRIFHILSAMFFSFIFNIWAELYYGIVIDHIESTPGRISFLIFSGVVPVRVLLLLQPPFKRLNFIFGIAAVIFFIARYTR